MRVKLLLRGLLASAALLAASSATATATVWLCSPERASDACRTDMTATVFKRSGATAVEPAPRATRPKVDCFYVYPTISDQVTTNANFSIDPPLEGVAMAQTSRFAPTCRIFAPVYRQLTVPSLVLRQVGIPSPQRARELAYGDVRDAWRDYLANHNRGRGVVLIGHSQGAGVLNRLVHEEIDPRRSQRRRLVSALLIGTSVLVRRNRDDGGDFEHVRACRSDRQIGCVVAYSSFLNTPPPDTLFGRVTRRGLTGRPASKLEVLCTDPVELTGSRKLIPYVPTRRIPGLVGSQTDEPPAAATPWAKLPDQYGGRCEEAGGANFERVIPLHADDPRPQVTENPSPEWGLHIIDVNIAFGNLQRLVARQAARWLRARG